jgi:small subunit ribosomal protein S4
LREKQKVKRMYGLLEKQFRGTFALADKSREITGEALLTFLERRLDNITYRLGFACSRADARMLVRHGHILVNGKRMSIPSYFVRAKDVISVGEKSRKMGRLAAVMEGAQRRGVPDWLELDQETFSGKIKVFPTRSDITTPINEKLIVELYSK